MPEDTTLPNADAGPVDCKVGRLEPARAAMYRLRYLCDGYIVADAFRPVPGWGAKGYTVQADALGDHTDADVIRAAQETAPVGYWLQHVEAIGGDPHRRDVFKKAVPWSLNKTPNALAWGGGHRNASGFTVSFAAATAFEV
jgi:hypothetical protein